VLGSLNKGNPTKIMAATCEKIFRM